MVSKKRPGIKTTPGPQLPPEADDFVKEGGLDAELQRSNPEVTEPVETIAAPAPRKRGRPATGKRSDNEWIGRTFYIKRETDMDVEELLLRLKRQGVEVDKSELVEILLAAWVKWHNGENLEIHLTEVSPIHKSKSSS